MKSGTSVASPTDEDFFLDCPEQICQLDLRGTVQNKSMSVDDATLNILCCWEDFQAKKVLKQGQKGQQQEQE